MDPEKQDGFSRHPRRDLDVMHVFRPTRGGVAFTVTETQDSSDWTTRVGPHDAPVGDGDGAGASAAAPEGRDAT